MTQKFIYMLSLAVLMMANAAMGMDDTAWTPSRVKDLRKRYKKVCLLNDYDYLARYDTPELQKIRLDFVNLKINAAQNQPTPMYGTEGLAEGPQATADAINADPKLKADWMSFEKFLGKTEQLIAHNTQNRCFACCSPSNSSSDEHEKTRGGLNKPTLGKLRDPEFWVVGENATIKLDHAKSHRLLKTIKRLETLPANVEVNNDSDTTKFEATVNFSQQKYKLINLNKSLLCKDSSSSSTFESNYPDYQDLAEGFEAMRYFCDMAERGMFNIWIPFDQQKIEHYTVCCCGKNSQPNSSENIRMPSTPQPQSQPLSMFNRLEKIVRSPWFYAATICLYLGIKVVKRYQVEKEKQQKSKTTASLPQSECT